MSMLDEIKWYIKTWFGRVTLHVADRAAPLSAGAPDHGCGAGERDGAVRRRRP
jgi:hypothetical protein